MRPGKSETGYSELLQRDQLLNLALDAYIFGFASVEMFRTMDEVAASQREKSSCIFNQFFHERQLATADDHWLAAPNAELLYSNAWLDLGSAPLLLQVPDMRAGYYVLQFNDFFANSFAHIGTRTLGSQGGRLAILGPNWSGSLPNGLTIIRSPTRFAWILGRIRVQEARELDLVHQLQDQLVLKPLTASERPVLPTESWPSFRADDNLDFFFNLDQVLRRNSPPEPDIGLISKLLQLGMLCESPFEPIAISPFLRDILEQAVVLGRQRICERESRFEEFCPGWIWEGLSAGSPGRDHLSRAASAKAGLGILPPEEAIYPLAYVDDQGKPLDGNCSYRLRFAPGELPLAKYFWSITVYDLPHYRLIRNPSKGPIRGRADGSPHLASNGALEFALQADCPAECNSHWLPTPRTGNFVVAVRVFGPSEALLHGKRTWPPVVRICPKNGAL